MIVIGPVHQEGITILHTIVCVSEYVSKHMSTPNREHEAELTVLKGEVDKSTVTIGVFNNPFSVIDETTR